VSYFFHEIMHWLGIHYLRMGQTEKPKSPASMGNEAGYYAELQTMNGLIAYDKYEHYLGNICFTKMQPGWTTLKAEEQGRAEKEVSYVLDKDFAIRFYKEYNASGTFWKEIEKYIRPITPAEKEFMVVAKGLKHGKRLNWKIPPK